MIRRENYLRRIRPFVNRDVVKVITGMRRCGKSVLLQLIQNDLKTVGVPESQLVTFNFESMANRRFCEAEALYAELQRRLAPLTGRVYLFFDEIQEVKDWQRCINSCRVDFDCDIYITGSNAHLLSGELATYLAGRYVETEVYPFSFSEFCEARKSLGLPDDPQATFRDYVVLGGMPALTMLQQDKETARQYLSDIFTSVVLKDIAQRNRIRDTDLLERIIAYLADNVGQLFSASNVSRFLKTEEDRTVTRETVLNYAKACENAFLFHRVPREDLSGKKVLTVNEKLYIADHGFREAINAENWKDIGQVLENLVCLELLRRGFSLTVGRIGSREVDFVARRGETKLYVQVAYLLATPDVVEREFGVLKLIEDAFPKYVVSADEFDLSRDGIRHFNIRDFLTDTTWG